MGELQNFKTQCFNCKKAFECNLDQIGQTGLCPFCSAEIEYVPTVTFSNENKQEVSISGNKLKYLIFAIILVLISIVVFFNLPSSSPLDNQHQEAEKRTTPKEIVNKPTTKIKPVLQTNNKIKEIDKAEIKKPYEFTVDYNEFINKMDALDCKLRGNPAFLVHPNLILSHNYVIKQSSYRVKIPTSYGYRETSCTLVAEFDRGLKLYEVNHGYLDLPPLKISKGIPRGMVIYNRMKNLGKKGLIDTHLQKINLAGIAFSENKELILPKRDTYLKEKKIVLDYELIKFIESFKSDKISFKDKNYSVGKKTWDYNEKKRFENIPAYKSEEHLDYTVKASSNSSKVLNLYPIAPDTFIYFGDAYLKELSVLNENHKLVKLGTIKTFALNINIYKSSDGFKVKNFYKLDETIRKPKVVNLFWLYQGKRMEKEFEVRYITTSEGKPVGRYNPNLEDKDTPIYTFLDIGKLPAKMQRTSIAAVSGKTLIGASDYRYDIRYIYGEDIKKIKLLQVGKEKKKEELKPISSNSKLGPCTNNIAIISRILKRFQSGFVDLSTNQFYPGPEKYDLLSVLKDDNDYYMLIFNRSMRKLLKVSYKQRKAIASMDFNYYTKSSLSADGGTFLTQYNNEVILIDLKSMTKKTVLEEFVKSIHWSHEENTFIVEVNKGFTEYSYKLVNDKLLLKDRRQKHSNNEFMKPIISPNYTKAKLGLKISDSLYYDSGYYLIYDNIYNKPLYSIEKNYIKEKVLDCRLINRKAVFLTLNKIVVIPLEKLTKL